MASGSEPLAGVDLVVHGEVQGVLYRESCRVEAEAHGVTGWVRNEYDGTVRAHLEGSAEAVEAVVSWARRGPRAARVDRVEVTEAPAGGATGFEVR